MFPHLVCGRDRMQTQVVYTLSLTHHRPSTETALGVLGGPSGDASKEMTFQKNLKDIQQMLCLLSLQMITVKYLNKHIFSYMPTIPPKTKTNKTTTTPILLLSPRIPINLACLCWFIQWSLFRIQKSELDIKMITLELENLIYPHLLQGFASKSAFRYSCTQSRKIIILY